MSNKTFNIIILLQLTCLNLIFALPHSWYDRNDPALMMTWLYNHNYFFAFILKNDTPSVFLLQHIDEIDGKNQLNRIIARKTLKEIRTYQDAENSSALINGFINEQMALQLDMKDETKNIEYTNGCETLKKLELELELQISNLEKMEQEFFKETTKGEKVQQLGSRIYLKKQEIDTIKGKIKPISEEIACPDYYKVVAPALKQDIIQAVIGTKVLGHQYKFMKTHITERLKILNKEKPSLSKEITTAHEECDLDQPLEKDYKNAPFKKITSIEPINSCLIKKNSRISSEKNLQFKNKAECILEELTQDEKLEKLPQDKQLEKFVRDLPVQYRDINTKICNQKFVKNQESNKGLKQNSNSNDSKIEEMSKLFQKFIEDDLERQEHELQSQTTSQKASNLSAVHEAFDITGNININYKSLQKIINHNTNTSNQKLINYGLQQQTTLQTLSNSNNNQITIYLPTLKNASQPSFIITIPERQKHILENLTQSGLSFQGNNSTLMPQLIDYGLQQQTTPQKSSDSNNNQITIYLPTLKNASQPSFIITIPEHQKHILENLTQSGLSFQGNNSTLMPQLIDYGLQQQTTPQKSSDSNNNQITVSNEQKHNSYRETFDMTKGKNINIAFLQRLFDENLSAKNKFLKSNNTSNQKLIDCGLQQQTTLQTLSNSNNNKIAICLPKLKNGSQTSLIITISERQKHILENLAQRGLSFKGNNSTLMSQLIDDGLQQQTALQTLSNSNNNQITIYLPKLKNGSQTSLIITIPEKHILENLTQRGLSFKGNNSTLMSQLIDDGLQQQTTLQKPSNVYDNQQPLVIYHNPSPEKLNPLAKPENQSLLFKYQFGIHTILTSKLSTTKIHKYLEA